MNLYLLVKWLHIVSSVLMVGTGLGSAFYLFFVNRSGSLHAQAVVSRLVVRADWWFTTPTIVLQPATGPSGVGAVRLLDLAAATVVLGLFAHHERVQRTAGRVHHGGGHRVRAEGQPADGREVPVRRQLSQQGADQRCGFVVQGDPAQVDVVVGLST